MKIINSCPFNLEDGKTRILWEITPRCNMKCKHCLFFDNNKKDLKKELSTNEIFKIIDNVSKDSSVNVIWISGGEPLLRKDIVEICNYISQKGIKPSISTNGILLTKDLVEKLHKAGVDYIHLSIDGSNSVTHNRIRGIDSAFEKLMEAMDVLKNSEVKTGASFMVTEESINEIDEVLELAQEKSLSVISFYLIAELGRGNKNFRNDKKELSRRLAKKISNIDKNKYKDLRIEMFRADTYEEEGVLQKCKGENFLNITYDGNLGACPWLMKSAYGFEEGSLLINDFAKTKEKCVKKMKELIQLREKNIDFCDKCDNKINCGKGCMALQIKNKEYNGVDPICPQVMKMK